MDPKKTPKSSPDDEVRCAVCSWCGEGYRVLRRRKPPTFCAVKCRVAYHREVRRRAAERQP